MATAGLAEEAPPSRDQSSPFLHGLSLTGGADYASAYFHRGYRHQDNGIIFQPFATISSPLLATDPVTVRPYLASWNSFEVNGQSQPGAERSVHDHQLLHGIPGRFREPDESEWMTGVLTTVHALTLDCKYTLYHYSGQGGLPIQEVGTRISYDLGSLWRDAQSGHGYALRPFAALYQETKHRGGREGTYLETGIEPAWRWELGGWRVGLSFPALVGMSLSDYYFDANGKNDTVGYASYGVLLSTPLPVSPRFGSWYLNGSVRYLHLFADNLVTLNSRHADAFVGMIGISCAFK